MLAFAGTFGALENEVVWAAGAVGNFGGGQA